MDLLQQRLSQGFNLRMRNWHIVRVGGVDCEGHRFPLLPHTVVLIEASKQHSG